MVLPSGTITMDQVNVELGIASGTNISLNQANVRALAGVPSGTIAMSNLQGKSASLVLTNISPALPGGQTSWNLGSSGDLTIFEYSTRSFQVQSPGSARVTLYGGGGGWCNIPINLGGRGGNVRGIYNFSSGVTYWIHLGQAGGSTPGAKAGSGGGGGASALTLSPSAAGTELLVAGGGGGSSDDLGGGNGSTSGGAGGGGPTGSNGDPSGRAGGIGKGASGTTGGAAGTGRLSATAGGNAPRGVGGYGSSGTGGRAGGLSGYAAGGRGGIAPGDSAGGGGGGGYAGGGGANNDAFGYGGGGGNGYTNPAVTSPSSGTGATFPGDPTSWGAPAQPGAIRFTAV